MVSKLYVSAEGIGIGSGGTVLVAERGGKRLVRTPRRLVVGQTVTDSPRG